MKIYKLFLSGFAFPLIAISQPHLPNSYYWQKMPNGLEVVVIENAKVPLANFALRSKFH